MSDVSVRSANCEDAVHISYQTKMHTITLINSPGSNNALGNLRNRVGREAG